MTTSGLSRNPGFVVEAQYESLEQAGMITREGSTFRLARTTTPSDEAVLAYLGATPEFGAGGIEPLGLTGRLRWGDLTLYELRVRDQAGDESRAPVLIRCDGKCTEVTALFGQMSAPDAAVLNSSFELYAGKYAPLHVVAPSVLVRHSVVHAFLPPASMSKGDHDRIVYYARVEDYPASSPRMSYDFATARWSTPGPVAPELATLAGFLSGLREQQLAGEAQADPAAPAPAMFPSLAQYLNDAFRSNHAQRFLYPLTAFDGYGAQVFAVSRLIPASQFASTVARWPAFLPLGRIVNGNTVYVLFSTHATLPDVQVLPVTCGAETCKLDEATFFAYPSNAVIDPRMLMEYFAHFGLKRVEPAATTP